MTVMNEIATDVFTDRYAQDGESVEGMWNRVASAIGDSDPEKAEFYRILDDFKFVPGGRVLAGAGKNTEQTYYNCVSGDTLIHTEGGLVAAASLTGRTVSTLTHDGLFRPAVWSSYGEQSLMSVVFENGDEIEATALHEWVVTSDHGDDQVVTTSDLVGRHIPMQGVVELSVDDVTFRNGVQHGLAYGDGTIVKGKYVDLPQFGDSKHLLHDFFAKVNHQPSRDADVVHGLPIAYKSLPETDDRSYLRGFVAGLIAADGHVDKRGSVMIHQAGLEKAVGIRRVIAKSGLPTVSLRVVRTINPWTGDDSIPLVRIQFSRYQFPSYMILKNLHREHLSSAPVSVKRSTVKVVRVFDTGKTEEVFCCVEPVTHTMVVGPGYVTRQCYVIPVEPKQSTIAATPNVGKDSREAIFDTISTMVDIMSRGGGVGINWSTLRPSGSHLARVSGTSSGPVGWMDVASKAVGEVEQGGSRRGAAMFMLNDWHPDIIKFIEAKRDNSKITNANVSVAVSDSFMEAVKANAGWVLRFPDTAHPEYNNRWDGDLAEWEHAGLPTHAYAIVPARDVWDAIVGSAHASGEPGLVFLDRYNKQSTGAHAEKIICVNPCGEQGLGAYSVCNLGAMNLGKYVGPSALSGLTIFAFDDFRKDVAVAVRFMDNVIDKSFYWDDRSKKRQEDLRRIGLGVMGLADALIMLGIRYGSPEAVTFTEDVFRTMKDTAIKESLSLAQEKGLAKAYTPSVWDRPYLKEFDDRNNGYGGLRNLFFLTQAPTGTTSTLAGASSGIEPLFDVGYIRKDRTGEHFVRPPVLDIVWPEGTVRPDYIVTANDIPVEEHVAMQAAVQKYVDSSVSKTVNAPNDQSVEEVGKLYMLAYDSGLKGLAYYRDGSRDIQVLNRETAQSDSTEVDSLKARIAQLEEEAFVGPTANGRYTRPKQIRGVTSRLNTSMGTMYLTLNTDDAGKPVEIFVNVGKAGSDVMSMGEAIGRLVSLSMQNGVSLTDIAGQLVGVGGTSSFNPGLVHAVGKALENAGSDSYVADPLPVQQKPRLAAVTNKTSGMACPDCKNFSVVRAEGCQKCQNCGWSAC